jgi:hypothetical protein
MVLMGFLVVLTLMVNVPIPASSITSIGTEEQLK